MHTLAEWRDKLAGSDGVWAAVQTATDLHQDPQVLANGYLADVDYGERTHRLVANPAQFDGEAPTLTRAPGAGEHTDEVLLQLGHAWDDVIALKVAGVVN
jgi:crotonobetainyl-CoA:carnitine CoA-transferase CaiB-like acyl-CoA transferase